MRAPWPNQTRKTVRTYHFSGYIDEAYFSVRFQWGYGVGLFLISLFSAILEAIESHDQSGKRERHSRPWTKSLLSTEVYLVS